MHLCALVRAARGGGGTTNIKSQRRADAAQPKTAGHVPPCKDQHLHTARWMAAGPAAAAAATATTTALQLVVFAPQPIRPQIMSRLRQSARAEQVL